MVTFADCFRGRSVWISGHTGFQGSWLTEWLLGLGANVHGFALAPAEGASLFEQLGLATRVTHTIGDVRDAEALGASLQAARPDYVFHLAAQSSRRAALTDPAGTHATNVMGTIGVLETLRTLDKACSAVIATGDCCYENRGWLYSYREEDALGGTDPLGASKAMAEFAVGSYGRTFFADGPVRVATARVGHVIAGGEWTAGRVVPDCVRALQYGERIAIRQKDAVRPWQHVLDVLAGYLWLAASLAKEEGTALAGAFNFAPVAASHRPVAELVQEITKHWPGAWDDVGAGDDAPRETAGLSLASEKAFRLLRWAPVWDFTATVRYTMAWYRDARMYKQTANFKRLTQDQIRQFSEAARSVGAVWTRG